MDTPVRRTLSGAAKIPIAAVIALAVMTGFSAVGCGGGSGSDSSATPTPTPTPTPTATLIGPRLVKVFSISPTAVSAAGGQPVVITGEGFSGRTVLTVSSSTSLRDPVIVSDTEIHATTVHTLFTGTSVQQLVVVIADGINSFNFSPNPVYLTFQN